MEILIFVAGGVAKSGSVAVGVEGVRGKIP